MSHFYPWNMSPIGEAVLWISVFAGITAALFNGITHYPAWQEAARRGASAVVAKIFYSIAYTLRSVFVGVFAGTLVGATAHYLGASDTMVVVLAGVAAFVADPLLRWVQDNWKRVLQKLSTRKPKNEG